MRVVKRKNPESCWSHGSGASLRQDIQRTEYIPNRQRSQRLAEHLCALGPRAVHELLVELIVAYGPGVSTRIEAYGRIDASIARALGADRFPERLRLVPVTV